MGWVIVDPTPTATTTAASPPPEQVRATPPTVPKQATALPGNSAAHAIAKPTKVPNHQPVHVNWLLVLGIGLPVAVIVAVLTGGLVVPAVRRRLRRVARHQPADPSLLAAGAWLEFLDGLSRLGVDVSPSATSTEVADQVAGRFGEDFGAPTRFVGEAADQALYSTVWPLEDARARYGVGLAAPSVQSHAPYRRLRGRGAGAAASRERPRAAQRAQPAGQGARRERSYTRHRVIGPGWVGPRLYYKRPLGR